MRHLLTCICILGNAKFLLPFGQSGGTRTWDISSSSLESYRSLHIVSSPMHHILFPVPLVLSVCVSVYGPVVVNSWNLSLSSCPLIFAVSAADFTCSIVRKPFEPF